MENKKFRERLVASIGRVAVSHGFQKAHAPRHWIRDTGQLRQILAVPDSLARLYSSVDVQWGLSEEWVASSILLGDWQSHFVNSSLMWGSPNQVCHPFIATRLPKEDDIDDDRAAELTRTFDDAASSLVAFLDKVTTRQTFAVWILNEVDLVRPYGSWKYPNGSTNAKAVAALLLARDGEVDLAKGILTDAFREPLADPSRGDRIRIGSYEPLLASISELPH